MSDAKAKFVGLGGERPDRYHKQSTKMLQHNGMMGWGIGECLFSLQIQLFFYLIQRLGMFSVLVHYRHGGRFVKLLLGNWQ